MSLYADMAAKLRDLAAVNHHAEHGGGENYLFADCAEPDCIETRALLARFDVEASAEPAPKGHRCPEVTFEAAAARGVRSWRTDVDE